MAGHYEKGRLRSLFPTLRAQVALEPPSVANVSDCMAWAHNLYPCATMPVLQPLTLRSLIYCQASVHIKCLVRCLGMLNMLSGLAHSHTPLDHA